MGLTDEKKQWKRASLMDSAFQLFTTQGITKTSIEDIAKKAGVAKGTFYLYFKDKYDLHQRLVQHKSEQLFQHALLHSEYQEQPTAADKVLAIADDMLDQLQENRWLLQFFNKNLSWGVFHRAVDRSDMDYQPVFENIFGADVWGDTDRRVEIYTILELIGSTCHSVILEGEPVDMDTFRPYLHRSVRAVMDSFAAA